MAVMVGIEHVLGNLEPFVHAYGAAAVMVILTFEFWDFRFQASLCSFLLRFSPDAANYRFCL